jgi:hypothetical protein
MTKYHIEVREVVFHTFEIETDLTDPDEIESFFYDMDNQEDYRVDIFPTEWIVDEIRKMGDKS